MPEGSGSSAGPVRWVVLYSRRACGLCDEAREVVLRELGRTRFRLEEVLIDGDPALERAYGERVPVVAVDGVERFEYRVDPVRFREVLRG
jgi:hypothetical protein